MAHLGLLVTMVAWGSMIPILSVLLERWDAFTLSALRYSVATPIMVGAVWLREGRLGVPPRRAWPKLALLGGVGIAGLATCYTVGLAYSDPVTAIVLQAASPVITTVVGWAMFGLLPQRGLGVALLLAFLGSLLTMWPTGAGPARIGLRGGEVLLVLGSVCWAWYSLACQRWLAGWSQLRITALTVIPAGATLIGIFGVAFVLGLTRTPVGGPDGRDMALILWVAVTAACAGVFLWNFGVNRLGLGTASLYLNAVPVFAVLIALVFGVVPTWVQLLGGVLVLAGVAQAQLRRSATSPVPSPSPDRGGGG